MFSKKKSWNFKKIWQFYEENVDLFFKFMDILSFQTQFRIQECLK